jgi:hypothetical protein
MDFKKFKTLSQLWGFSHEKLDRLLLLHPPNPHDGVCAGSIIIGGRLSG